MDLLSDLNEPQRRAVTHVDGPLLVLAGAGSGKTRVITRRTAHLIACGVPPRRVLAITFTNKAAEEMRRRIDALGVAPGATICTFHSLCARLLREFAERARVSSNYSIYDRADQLRLTKEAIARLELAGGELAPAKVHATISNAKNDLKTPAAYASQAGGFYTRNVAAVYREYEKMLAANNALDFDDLLLRVSFLLRDCPEIREQLGRRFQYVLVDEYQDTNRAQYIIAHGFALDHENLCVTGDPDQSIYAWRGADIGNILEFEKDYPNATVVRLEQNYRSTQPILAAAGRLISRNAMRKRKELWTDRAGGADVRVVCCDDEHAEADLIVRRLADLRDGGGNLDDSAVFYRVNSLSRVLEEAFLRAGVAYRIARGVEFYNRKVVRDLLAYLRILVNDADDLSCMRIINTPARGIGARTVERLRAFAESTGLGLLDVCRRADHAGLGNAAAKKVKAFADTIASLAADLDRPVRDVMEEVAARSGMEDAYRGDDEDARQARANIAELITTAREFDEHSDGDGLSEYLHQISLVSDVDHLDGAGGGAVTLMTLHAAKGLEFPRVFIVGCEDGLLPFSLQNGSPWSSPEPRDVEEERRLAFVGMTRAKDELTLSCVRYRMVRGQRKPQTASTFLSEIAGRGVVVQDATTPREESASQRRRYAGGAGKRRARPGGGGFYADTEDRAVIEAMAEALPQTPELEYLRIGGRVRHPSFGTGTLTGVGSQPWPDTRVSIAFDEFGIKKIVIAKTSLELLDEKG